jgi:hypothetical protein
MTETGTTAAVRPIRGCVAQILSERELIINVGKKHGVSMGMKFAVLAQSPLDVIDPVSGEKLDTVDREKVRVEATEVREKITICRTYRKYRIGGEASLPPWYSALWSGSSALTGLLPRQPEPPREVLETLRASDSSLPKPLSPEESYVMIKDRVIEIND